VIMRIFYRLCAL